MKKKVSTTSWQDFASSYDKQVGQTGHYYHKEVILPNLLPLLSLKKESSLIDLGCGQGFIALNIPKEVFYTGLDLSKKLLDAATSHSPPSSKREFILHDMTKPFPVKKTYTHALCCLAMQNVKEQEALIAHTSGVLEKDGRFFIILNHPAFRIPRQSSWEYDEKRHQNTRKLFSYMSPQDIPIDMTPSKKEKIYTFSFHYPLSYYFEALSKNGFVIENMHEWCCSKTSTGSKKKIENRARKEFPLFLTIVARKL